MKVFALDFFRQNEMIYAVCHGSMMEWTAPNRNNHLGGGP
jgi:hypothetical protein